MIYEQCSETTLIARFSMNKVGQNKKHVLFSFISTNFRDIKKHKVGKGKKVAPIICARKKSYSGEGLLLAKLDIL